MSCMDTAGMEAVIYNRVSRLAEGSTSTRDQDGENRAWCERERIPVDRVFTDEGIGASRHSQKVRAAWSEVKEYLRPGHILVIWEASRAGRDLGEFYILRELCADLQVPLAYNGRVFDLNDGDDRFNAGLDALISEKETEKARERIRRGKRTAAAEGRVPGRPPWGYQMIGQGKNANWIPDPIEAPRVREAVRRLLDGEGQFTVLKWLQSTGYAPTSTTNLRRALTTPSLAGLRKHQGTVVLDKDGALKNGTWESIITVAQHEKLVARAANKALRYCNSGSPVHLVSGIAKCGKCGDGLNYRFEGKNRPPSYGCRQGHVSRVAGKVDARVEKALFDRLAYLNAREYEATDDAQITEIQEAIKDNRETLEAFKAEALKGKISPASFGEFETALDTALADLRKRLMVLLAADEEFPTVEELREIWPHQPIRDKRDLIRKLRMSVTVPQLGSRRRALDSDTIIEWPDF